MKFLSLIFICSFSISSIIGQNDNSLDENYILAFDYYEKSRIDSAQKYVLLYIEEFAKTKDAIDSEEAFEMFYVLGRCYSKKNKFRESENIYRQGITYLTPSNDPEKQLFYYCQIGNNYFFEGRPESIDLLLDTIYQFKQTHEINAKKSIADIKYIEGQKFMQLNENQKADSLFEVSQELYRNAGDTLNNFFIKSFQRTGNIANVKGEFSEAIKLHNKALDLTNIKYGRDSYQRADHLSNIGLNYSFNKEYDKAIAAIESSIALKINHDGRDNLSLGPDYINIGILCNEAGEANKAINYFHKSIKLFKKSTGLEYFNAAYAYANLVVSYSNLGEYEQANANCELLDGIINEADGKLDHLQNPLLFLRGKILMDMKDYPGALKVLDSVDEFYKLNPPADRTLMISNKIFKSTCYMNAGQLDLCENELNQSKSILNSLPDYNSSLDSDINHEFARLYFQKKDIQKALDFNLAAIKSLRLDLDKINLNELTELQKVFQLVVTRMGYINSLDQSEANLDQLDKLSLIGIETIENALNRAKGEEDKYTNKDAFREHTDFLITYLIELYQKSQNEEILERILKLMELNKNTILLSQFDLSSKFNKQLFENPLIKQEKDVIEKLKSNRANLFSLLPNEADFEKRRKDHLDTLYNNIEQYESIKKEIQHAHPTYYNAKYGFSLPSINELQQKTLEGHDVFIQFYFGANSICRQIIAENYATVKSISYDDDFEENLKLWLQDVKDPKSSMSNIRQRGSLIYETLFAETNIPSEANVIIVNDGFSHYIPFEALCINNKDGTFQFLVERHAIGYALSASHYFKSRNFEKDRSKTFYGFAPEYNSEKVVDNELLTVRSFGNIEYNLEGALNEVKDIKDIVGGYNYTGLDVTESHFKQVANGLDIIHLACHGRISDEFPSQSAIIFNQQDSLNDGVLTAAEIYKLNLPNSMAVLSACETGQGPLKRGEGLLSLSRAFAFAGAQTTVYSLWKIPDLSTSDIMVNFYENLKNGFTKHESIQNAKLSYINDTKIEKQKHPYFWAGLSVQGNLDPIKFKGNDALLYYILAGFFGLIMFLLYKNRAKAVT